MGRMLAIPTINGEVMINPENLKSINKDGSKSIWISLPARNKKLTFETEAERDEIYDVLKEHSDYSS